MGTNQEPSTYLSGSLNLFNIIFQVDHEEERDTLSSFTLASGVGPAFCKPPMSPRAIGLQVSDTNY